MKKLRLTKFSKILIVAIIVIAIAGIVGSKLYKDYKYKLSYINGDNTVTFVFDAHCNAIEMRDMLKDFLCSCSWSESIVKNQILNYTTSDNDDEEYLTEH